MKVNVYANWDNAQVMSEAEANEYIADCASDYFSDTSCFDDWLEDNYSPYEVWQLSDEGRAKVEKNFLDFCHAMAEEDFERTWDVREIEI